MGVEGEEEYEGTAAPPLPITIPVAPTEPVVAPTKPVVAPELVPEREPVPVER